MEIKRVIIHKKLVDSFKRKAAKTFPHEHMVALLGRQVDETLYIYAIDKMTILSSKVGVRVSRISYDQPEEEIEAGSRFKYFGTLHSHPGDLDDAEATLSDVDKKTFLDSFNNSEINVGRYEHEFLRDQIMGILRIIKKPKVYQYGLFFYNISFEPLELLISENRTKNRQKS